MRTVGTSRMDATAHTTAWLRHWRLLKGTRQRHSNLNCLSALPGGPSCSNEEFHCSGLQAPTLAHLCSTEGKSIRIDSHSYGRLITWEANATVTKEWNRDAGKPEVSLRSSGQTGWCRECKLLCPAALRDYLLRLLLKEFRAWKGVDQMTPFKVPLHPKIICFLFQHLQHLPDAQHPGSFCEGIKKPWPCLQGGSHPTAERGPRTPPYRTTECVIHPSGPQSQVTEDGKSLPGDSP